MKKLYTALLAVTIFATPMPAKAEVDHRVCKGLEQQYEKQKAWWRELDYWCSKSGTYDDHCQRRDQLNCAMQNYLYAVCVSLQCDWVEKNAGWPLDDCQSILNNMPDCGVAVD